jgi:hypothetical protein
MNRNVNKIGIIMLSLGYTNVLNAKLNVHLIRDARESDRRSTE